MAWRALETFGSEMRGELIEGRTKPGMGLAVTIFLTFEAVVFWQLGSLAKTHALRLRPIMATFAIAYFAMAVNSYSYFFIAPVIVESVIAACLVLGIVTAKPQAAADLITP